MKSVLLLGFAAALLVPSAAAPPTVKGSVGPGPDITLTSGGKAVHQLKAGKYRIKVSDKSDMHNFHLKGPGVDKKTSVDGEGNVTWTVTFKKGKYAFQCDAHPDSMHGHFSVTK
jgi:plastocyanin